MTASASPPGTLVIPGYPAASTQSVIRSRLVSQILGVAHDDPDARDLVTEAADVTVVTAPAGAGKSVVMQESHARATALGRHAVWFGVEPSDNAPETLWTRLADATARAVSGINHAVADRLTASPAHARRRTGEALRQDYVEALAELTDPLHVFIDDADVLTSEAGCAELTWLVTHQPAHLHVVVAGRSAPPLSLARLRVEGRLLELRERDLRLDVVEAGQLLAAADVTLTDNDLATLVQRCEGWAAALRLAALDLQHVDDPTRFVDQFSGSSRAVAEFIDDEVLGGLSEPSRTLLVRTATASSLTVELAVELSGRSDAGAILEKLERKNALVYQTCHNPATYRYHPLLRDHLRSRLAMEDAAASASMERRLAHWWADRDDTVAALHHAVSAGAWDLAADLITRHGADLTLAGDHDALLAAFDAAPSWLSHDGRVATWAVTAAASNGDSVTVRRYLDRAWHEDIRCADPHERLLVAIAIMHEAQLTGTLDADRRRVLTDLVHSRDSSGLMALIHAARGVTYTWLGDRAEAIADLRRAWGLVDRHRHAATRVDIAAHLCLNAIAKGDARQIQMWVDESPVSTGVWESPGSKRSAWLHDMAAWSAWLRIDRADARRYIDLANGAERGITDHSTLNAAVITAAIDYDERPDNRREAVQAIRSAHRQLPVTGSAPADTMLCLVSVEVPLALAIGEIGWAEQALERLPATERDSADARVLEAQIFLASGKSPAARAMLSAITDEPLSCRLQTMEATAWALQSHLSRISGEPARAHDFLMRALELADYADTPRALTFTPIHDLLIWERGRLGHLEELAERIGVARQDLLGGSSTDTNSSLTVRELEVLRDLPSLMPLDQIAKVHVVSANTVKTHVKSIYRKLGVSGRRAAVDRARSLGLI